MTKSEIAKFAVATILGIVSAHLWSIGEQRLSIFLIATTVYQIFFVVEDRNKINISKSEFSTLFAEEMKKWKNNNLFK